jgi:methylglutaconyl-CoA hydratase
VISAFLLRKVSAAWLTPWMLSARIFSAAEALQGGLVHALANNQEQLDQMVQERLQNYRQVGIEAVRATKKLLMQLPSQSLEEQKQNVCQVIAERRVSTEGQEGLQSFLEKRTPSWRPE